MFIFLIEELGLISLKAVAHISNVGLEVVDLRQWLTPADFKSRDVNLGFSTHLFQLMPSLSRPALGLCNNYVLYPYHGSCLEQLTAMNC